jgi:hypothetical protein
MTSSRYTPQSPEVVAILDGIWKSGIKTYFRVDVDGKHIDVKIREELIAALGISSKLATRLLQQAELPCAPFVCTRAREKARPASMKCQQLPAQKANKLQRERSERRKRQRLTQRSSS